MNTSADLKRRLLRLFPVSILKSHFTPTSKTQSDILTELIQKNDEEIVQFAFSNLEFTRQHVFLFEHSLQVEGLSNIDVLPASFISRHTPNGKVILNYLYE